MNAQEKRRHPRISSVNLSYVCLDEDHQIVQQAMGKTVNISQGGYLLETHFPIAPERLLVASIGLRDDMVEIRGRVAYCIPAGEGRYAVGVEILDLDTHAKETWRKFLTRIDNMDGESRTPS